MAEILSKEGVSVMDDKVQNFQEIFWDPECLLKESGI
jgi:hypothetical protein